MVSVSLRNETNLRGVVVGNGCFGCRVSSRFAALGLIIIRWWWWKKQGCQVANVIQHLYFCCCSTSKESLFKFELHKERSIEIKMVYMDTPTEEERAGKSFPAANHVFLIYPWTRFAKKERKKECAARKTLEERIQFCSSISGVLVFSSLQIDLTGFRKINCKTSTTSVIPRRIILEFESTRLKLR